MQLSITGHHVDVTEALKNYVTERFARLSRHSDRVLEAHVVLSAEKLLQKAEATVQVAGTTLFAEDAQEDLYAAVDALIDKLDRQLLRHKEKSSQHSR
ncbi:MAG TPA: ribosome-associated translation inhibitor RaiA [Methylococcus sp.]|nr:ribosome-associated translation inhibitor RaiA [Methylococcus sp.]